MDSNEHMFAYWQRKIQISLNLMGGRNGHCGPAEVSLKPHSKTETVQLVLHR